MHIENSKSIAQQLQSLKIGKGVQYLLNEAFRLLGNPVLLHDMDYKLIACTENVVSDDPIWNEFVSKGTVGIERIEFYKNECFLDTVASVPKITYLHSDSLQYDRIFAKLFNRDHIQIGCVVIEECHKPFNNDDLTLFEIFSDVLDAEIAKSTYFRNYGQEYREKLINKLLEGCFEDRGIHTAHIESIYINLKTHLNLALVDMGLSNPQYSMLPFYRDLFKRTCPDFTYAIVNKHILIIMSFDEPSFHIKEALKKLNKIFQKNNMYAGISSSFENLFELRQYYTEAVEALNYGLKTNCHERIYLYDEMNYGKK